mmetsp:Transcript_28039/g.82066  ORF Transcript_28039/g.82066 Transcript_28039/m.82066 type:complete len:138 (-) Transcript_28039:232-645(-)
MGSVVIRTTRNDLRVADECVMEPHARLPATALVVHDHMQRLTAAKVLEHEWLNPDAQCTRAQLEAQLDETVEQLRVESPTMLRNLRLSKRTSRSPSELRPSLLSPADALYKTASLRMSRSLSPTPSKECGEPHEPCL